MTAVGALELVGHIKQGQTVLVTAAAGGTGHVALQWAKGAYTYYVRNLLLTFGPPCSHLALCNLQFSTLISDKVHVLSKTN